MPVKEFSICCSYDSKNSLEINRCFIAVKNGWFEGFMIEDAFNNTKNNVGVVFGFYLPNGIIDMFYCYGDKIIRYCVEKDNDYYNGNFSSINMVLTNKGTCIFKEINYNVYTKDEILNKVNICKSLFSSEVRKFYDFMLENREKFIYFSCYQNHPFPRIVNMLGNNPIVFDKKELISKRYVLMYDDKKGYDKRV